MASYVIERHLRGDETRRYWAGTRQKWSVNLDDAIIVSTERASEIVAEAPKQGSGRGRFVYSIEELAVDPLFHLPIEETETAV
jgi:hypothetical protein